MITCFKKKVDAKNKTITLVYRGDVIAETEIKKLESKLKNFDLSNAKLEIHQGFSYLQAANKPEEANQQTDQLNLVIKAKEAELIALRKQVDSVQYFKTMGLQVYAELKTQYTDLLEAGIGTGNTITNDSTSKAVLMVVLNFAKKKSPQEKIKLLDWLQVRFRRKDIKLIF